MKYRGSKILAMTGWDAWVAVQTWVTRSSRKPPQSFSWRVREEGTEGGRGTRCVREAR